MITNNDDNLTHNISDNIKFKPSDEEFIIKSFINNPPAKIWDAIPPDKQTQVPHHDHDTTPLKKLKAHIKDFEKTRMKGPLNFDPPTAATHQATIDFTNNQINTPDFHTQNPDGTWSSTPAIDPVATPTYNACDFRDENITLSFCSKDESEHLSINMCKRATTSTQPAAFPFQSDPGANANLSITTDGIKNIQYIKPFYATSAKKGSTMMLTAIGMLPITVGNESLRIKTYVSPDADGNLISPNAICKQYTDRCAGWVMYANHDKTTGRIQMRSRTSENDFNMNVVLANNLWWHPLDENPDDQPHQAHTPSRNIRLNSLSTAALYELWHQHTLHAGNKVLQDLHKHVIGVPKLRGNCFYQCPSCMAGKLCTK